jgi:diguanylate cyclase (GGDEF)-like protein
MLRAILGEAVSPGDEFRALPRVARIYVSTTILLGAAAIALDVMSVRFARPVLFVEMLALAIATSTVKISVPLPRSASSLSLSFAITLAAIPILGGTEACLVGMASAWTQCTFRMKSRNPLHRTVFSIAMVAVSVHVALLMFTWARAHEGIHALDVVRPILFATTGYFVANSLLLAAAVGLATRQPVLGVWVNNFLWSAPPYFIAGAVAILGVMAADTGREAWALALGVPLYLTYRSYRTFVARIEDEQAQVRRLSQVQLATIEALALAIEVKDGTSQDHVREIQRCAEALARAADMPEAEIHGVKTAALLHDIGNLAVPEHILIKPGPLSAEEFQRLKIHPEIGAEILRPVPFPYPVASLILGHHERWDGTGYPFGLRGEEIPLGARVLAVADCFTSMMAERPHRPARAFSEAVSLLQQQAGTALDPALTQKFLRLAPSLQQQVGGFAAGAPIPPAPPASTGGSALLHIVAAHREVKVLYEIAEELGTSLSLDDVVALLAAKLPAVLPCACGALFLWDAEARLFRCKRASGIGEDRVGQLTGATLPAFGAQLPVVADADVVLRSILTSPLMSGGQAFGALAVYDVGADAYQDDHRRLLDRLAHQAAAVVSNAIVFEQAHEASLTDSLTGLANRRALHRQLPRHLARAGRERVPMTLLLLDVNNLKHINDAHGHDVGDRALRHTGAILASMQRPYDLCVRYGGDEFVAVLWDCGRAHAERRRDELQRAIADTPLRIGDSLTANLSVSAGAATFPDDGATVEALVAIADQRMYIDKALRRSYAAGTLSAQDRPVSVAV